VLLSRTKQRLPLEWPPQGMVPKHFKMATFLLFLPPRSLDRWLSLSHVWPSGCRKISRLPVEKGIKVHTIVLPSSRTHFFCRTPLWSRVQSGGLAHRLCHQGYGLGDPATTLGSSKCGRCTALCSQRTTTSPDLLCTEQRRKSRLTFEISRGRRLHVPSRCRASSWCRAKLTRANSYQLAWLSRMERSNYDPKGIAAK